MHVVTGSIPNFIALTPVYLAAKFSGKKIVLSIGGGYWEREAHLTSLRSGVVRLLLKLPDMVIGCNVGLTDAVGSLGVVESRRTCISNALPSKQGDRDSVPIPDEFSRIRSNADKILLYVGALKPWYGLLETLDTFAELRNNGVHAALVALVKEGGDAEYLSAVFDKAKAYALSEHFHLFVSVPWAVSAMALSDVIVRATNAIEGDSRAVREALAIGVPVIASDIGYRPEGVILFKAGDARSMQKAVVKALYLSSHNVTKSDSIEGKNNIRRILEIYKKLLD